MGIAVTGKVVRSDPRHATARRWMQVGHVFAEEASDSRSAGRVAAQRALAGDDARLAIAFFADSFDARELGTGVRETIGDVPLIGCTTAGEISSRGAGDGGAIVTILGGEGLRVRTGAGQGPPEELRSAGAEAAQCLPELGGNGGHRALMLLTEGVGGNKQEAIRGVHDVVGSGIPLVGGCAGDGMRMQESLQLHDDEVLSGSVVAAAIESEAPIGIGWSHGWERVGEPLFVTRSEGNRVLEIADRPALDEYLERLDAPDEVRGDPHAFTRWARTHPLGLGRRRNGHEPVRCVGEADFDARALVCTAEVPSGGFAWFMHGGSESVLRSTAAACSDAISSLGENPPRGLIAFDCIGRRGVLGDERIGDEAAEIARCAGGAPVAGLYTYGEIARRKGVNALHSQTFVAMAVA